jgi:hypothetical protein
MEKEDSKRDLGEVDDTGLKLHSIDALTEHFTIKNMI